MKMLNAVSAKVLETGADVGLAFDGDGDRCGVVANDGHEIFADKVGVMLARDISSLHKNAKFVVDVKSTGLFTTDPVLNANGATTTYWKTGHSYIKRFNFEHKTLVGFEKSGHFFFNEPLGRGYDDGLVSALAVCDMLDRNPGKSVADLRDALPKTWSSPTMSPHCDDEKKYDVVERVTAHYKRQQETGGQIAGQAIRDLITVNGVRVMLDDGTWGLVRASSNKPELVVVVESPTSEANMKAIFKDIDQQLSRFPEVGEYNQKIAVLVGAGDSPAGSRPPRVSRRPTASKESARRRMRGRRRTPIPRRALASCARLSHHRELRKHPTAQSAKRSR
jgi:phosphomannomutase/phosphoglucomutase